MTLTTNRLRTKINQITNHLSSLTDRELMLIALGCTMAHLLSVLLLFVLFYFAAIFNAETLRYVPMWAHEVMDALYTGASWWVSTMFDIIKAVLHFFIG